MNLCILLSALVAVASSSPVADPHYAYYGYGLGHYYGYGLGYGHYYPYYGHYWGRKKRSADALPNPEPVADPNPEADAHYGYYGYGGWHSPYYGYAWPYYHGYYWG